MAFEGIDQESVEHISVYVSGAGWYRALYYKEYDDHVVEIYPLPGCIGVGTNRNEALNIAARHGVDWVKEAKDLGWDIPEAK